MSLGEAGYVKSIVSGLAMLSCLASGSPVIAQVSDATAPLIAQGTPAATSKKSVEPQDGVTDSEIAIGSCIALTGTLQERGHQIILGANTYFNYINENGGVNGRKINLTVCDDAYEPEKAIECFNNCLKHRVFLGAFFAGSAPISKYARMGDANKFPLFGYCTGTPVVYELHPTQFVLRAGYADELHRQISELMETHGLKRIAILYQNDAFGAAIRASAISELKKFNVVPITEASYSRLTTNIDDAFNQIRDSKPQAVILGATSDAFKAVMKKRAEQKWNALCLCPSIDIDYAMEIGSAADGVILSQVVPSLDDKIPTATLYHKLLKKYSPDAHPSVSGFEGFFNAMVLAEVLKEAGRDLTRDKFLRTIESWQNKDFGLGKMFKVSFSPTKHAAWGSESVFFQIVRNGKLVTMTPSDWKAAVAKVAQ